MHYGPRREQFARERRELVTVDVEQLQIAAAESEREDMRHVRQEERVCLHTHPGPAHAQTHVCACHVLAKITSSHTPWGPGLFLFLGKRRASTEERSAHTREGRHRGVPVESCDLDDGVLLQPDLDDQIGPAPRAHTTNTRDSLRYRMRVGAPVTSNGARVDQFFRCFWKQPSTSSDHSESASVMQHILLALALEDLGA